MGVGERIVVSAKAGAAKAEAAKAGPNRQALTRATPLAFRLDFMSEKENGADIGLLKGIVLLAIVLLAIALLKIESSEIVLLEIKNSIVTEQEQIRRLANAARSGHP